MEDHFASLAWSALTIHYVPLVSLPLADAKTHDPRPAGAGPTALGDLTLRTGGLAV